MRIRLRVRAVENREEYFWEHRGREFVIGRGQGCALRFDSAAADVVSWEHAKMELAADGVSIADLGSSNGTFVNGVRIQEKTLLKRGDRVALGRSGPTFEVDEVETVAPVAAPPPNAAIKPLPRAAGRPPIVFAPWEPAGARPDKPPIGGGSSSSDGIPQRSGERLPSTVFRRLAHLQRGQRIGLLFAGLLACLLAGAVVAVFAYPKFLRELLASSKGQADNDLVEAAKDVGKQVIDRLIHSVVCVVGKSDPESKELHVGSGTLIDRERRLILTNAHVASQGTLMVYFPEWRDGRLATDHKFYAEEGLARPARVLRTEPAHDLALLQIDDLPADAAPLPLAEVGASPGDVVHSIGNPPVSGALWIYSTGTVRQVCRKKHVTVEGHPIDAQVVITQVPINRGDSGSAVVNNQGQLIGVNYCGVIETGVRDITYAIDLTEVRALLTTLPP